MSFYNINNEEISQESILEDLITYYQGLTESGKSKVDDFHEGSEVRTLLEVLSHLAYNILEEQNNTLSNHFINTAEGEYLDLLGANPNVNLPRVQGATSTGLVKFSIPEAVSEELVIPADTSVSDGEVEFVTVEDGIISIGDLFTYVPVECTVDGVDGNVPVGSITVCELSDFTVVNDDAFTNGADFEEDEDYRQRLLDFVREDNFGSRGWYENQILSIEGVHDIKQYPGSSLYYIVNTNDLINIDNVYNMINDYFSDNNHKIVGHTVPITKALLHSVGFTITVNSDCGYSEDDIKDFFKCYFKGGDLTNYPIFFDGLNMGEEVTSTILTDTLQEYFTDITSATISDVTNVYDGTTTTDFDFQPSTITYCAYSINEVEVVFE